MHILLSINRPDLAQKEYAAARTWADDALLIQVRLSWREELTVAKEVSHQAFSHELQLIEAYLGIYSGGRAAQQAYYVYDELAQNPSQAGKLSSVVSLTGKAVARMVSGEYTEADTVLAEAIGLVSMK